MSEFPSETVARLFKESIVFMLYGHNFTIFVCQDCRKFRRCMVFCKIAADSNDNESVQIKLLCGSDVLESFAVPGLWTNEDVSYHILKLVLRPT